ncbi:hypothetical protein PGTUg99_027363 [Puccinia graminis f. sp. tritici]|uniref:Uncharacterized protein n=1 Tax=Puccinia graminis f. sp. tritici TaxID=56615 RepID=A0A5B0RF71_PUCGR|nr:hypothetical protein PGTUg99_027363 [Puccinia graminis f. sp. tritici]
MYLRAPSALNLPEIPHSEHPGTSLRPYLSRKRVNELLSKLWAERGMGKLCFLSRPHTKTNGRFKDFQLRLVDLLLVKSTPVTFRDHPGKIDFLRPTDFAGEQSSIIAISEISAIRLTRVDLCDLYLIGTLAEES